MGYARPDQNNIHSLIAVSSSDGSTPIELWADPTTHALVLGSTSIASTELNNTNALTSLRDLQTAQRYTVLADSVADGLAAFWTQTTANGGTITVTGGEGVLDTSASATGAAQIVSTAPIYYPGQSTWFNSAMRMGDTGSAGNVRRLGVFTVSGTTPQDGFYYELNGTTFNAVVVKAGTPTTTASTSWSRVASSPFTLDTNYHSFEIRWTANRVDFYVDNIVRHTFAGTTTAITTTLNFPMAISNVNTSGASSRTIAVRNCGIGRFGQPDIPLRAEQSTSSSVASSASNVTLLAANSLRKGASIYNESSVILYVKFGATASVTSYKVQIPANGYYEVPAGYTGRIDGLWASANGFARIAEEI